MDDRDWRAPITLARNAPVAQAILRLALAPAFFLGLCDHIRFRLVDGHAVHPVRIHDDAGVGVGDISFKMAVGQIAIGNDAGHRQIIFAREIKVALVMCWTAKDRTRAVIHQDEIGDINRQVPAWIQRVLNGKPCIEAKLFSGFNVGRCRSAFAAFCDKVMQIRRVGCQLLRDRMVGSNGNKACAEHGVGARGKYINAVVTARKAEAAFQALRFANPVFLHQPHLVGPLVKRPQANKQFFCKVGNLQKPLAQLAAFNRRTRSPALAVDHLLIGEHRHVDRVPVHGGLFAVDEPGGVKLQEQGLFMPVIFRLASREFAGPVNRKAKPFQLRFHVCNIVARPTAGVDFLLHRRIFRRHAKGVPAHGVQHFMSGHALIPR